MAVEALVRENAELRMVIIELGLAQAEALNSLARSMAPLGLLGVRPAETETASQVSAAAAKTLDAIEALVNRDGR